MAPKNRESNAGSSPNDDVAAATPSADINNSSTASETQAAPETASPATSSNDNVSTTSTATAEPPATTSASTTEPSTSATQLEASVAPLVALVYQGGFGDRITLTIGGALYVFDQHVVVTGVAAAAAKAVLNSNRNIKVVEEKDETKTA
jgi:hypothetical protein